MGLSFVPTRLSDLHVDVTLTGVARGDVLYRGASKWNNLAPGTNGQVLTSGGAGADPSWTTAAGGGSNPFDDATAIIKGSADATKLLRFEVDGFTTATTRVLTPPNGNGTLALATGLAGGQTIDGGTAASETLNLLGTSHATKGAINFNAIAQIDELGNVIANGTLGAPPTVAPFTFAGDTDTGFFHRSADTIGIMTGGVTRGYFRSDGTFYLTADVDNNSITPPASQTLKMFISGGIIYINNSSASDLDAFAFRGADAIGSKSGIRFVGDGAANLARIVSETIGAGGAGSLDVYTSASGGTLVRRWRVQHTGEILLTGSSALTNSVNNWFLRNHNSSGTPAAGFGSGELWALQSSTTADQPAAIREVIWNDATHATRTADLVDSVYYTSTKQEALRARGSSGGVLTSVNGVTPVARQLLATGAGATVDQVITTLQNFGILKQS